MASKTRTIAAGGQPKSFSVGGGTGGCLPTHLWGCLFGNSGSVRITQERALRVIAQELHATHSPCEYTERKERRQAALSVYAEKVKSVAR